MATTSIKPPTELAPAITSLLATLRARVRRYVWLEGICTSITWLGIAFWASLMIDYLFEPPPAVRVLMLLGILAVLVGIVVRLIGRRAFVPLTDSNMATVLERRFGGLEDYLLTSVVLNDGCHDREIFNEQMLDRTSREAAQRVGMVNLDDVFDDVPLRRVMASAILLSATIVTLGALAPSAFGMWAKRTLLMSNELWPRQCTLLIDGFDEDSRVKKVARGADLEIIARADTGAPLVPQVVQVRYRTEGGARGRATMNRLGDALASGEPFQEYSHTFQGILAPIEFDVYGGDDSVRDLRIEVVDSPTIVDMQLECHYPEYTNHPTRALPVTGVMQIPQGTKITVRSKSNKDLLRVQIDNVGQEEVTPRTVLDSSRLAATPREFAYTIAALAKDTTLMFTLSDTDGITSREPVRLNLVAVADQPPSLDVQLRGIGTAVTPEVRIPVAGTVSDDFGVDKVWFEYALEDFPPKTHALSIPAGYPTEFELNDAVLDLGDKGFRPGQKLLVNLKAVDRYNLTPAENVGSSERWLLDVVTADELRQMLEMREVVLRQRFETIINEVAETRDLLLDINLDDAAADGENAVKDDEANDAEATPDGQPPHDGSEPGDTRDAPDGNEPGDTAGTQPGTTPMQQLALRTLKVERALTNARKSTHETQGVADAFDDIHQQMINNSIDTEELNRRLHDGIVEPLNFVAQQMFPELERRLVDLEKNLNNPALAAPKREAARQQASDLLLAMQKVLDRMIELRDYKELVELLRTIIDLQEDLSEQTKKRQQDKLRELLED